MTTISLSVREFYEFRRVALPMGIDFSYRLEDSNTVSVQAPSSQLEELGY